MTLKVTANGVNYSLGPGAQTLVTIDNIKITWSGDGSDHASVFDHNGNEIGRFKMPVVGFAAEIGYTVHVAPIELGEATTEVKRAIGLERI